MELITDEPTWKFTDFPGFEPRHLRVWRSMPGMLIAVVTELVDENDQTNGTSLYEAHELVLQQLHADYPGNEIEYIFCESRAETSSDIFTRITFTPDGVQHGRGLMTNRLISRLNARHIYRPYRSSIAHDQ